MKKNNKKEETFSLTFKGLISQEVVDYDKLHDLIELYMRRHGYNAILLEDGLVFRKIELIKGKK